MTEATITSATPVAVAQPEVTLKTILQKPFTGHFIGTLATWTGLPKYLVGPGNPATGQAVVARLHQVLSDGHAIYKYEAWGQNITSVITLTGSETDPVAPFFHPDWYFLLNKTATGEFSLKQNLGFEVTANNERLTLVETKTTNTPAGLYADLLFTSASYIVRLRLPLFWRSPLCRVEVIVQRRNLDKIVRKVDLTIKLPSGLSFLPAESSGQDDADTARSFSTFPYTGCIYGFETIVCPAATLKRTDPESIAALGNGGQTLRGLPLSWNKPFLGTPIVYSTGQESLSLAPRDYPNAPGADASFGITSSSVIYRPFGTPENIYLLETAALRYLAQPSHWLEPGTAEPVSIAPGSHPNLTMHKMHPWTNESQVRYMDGLGVFGQYESANPSPAGIWNNDHEHRSIAPLASAFVLTGLLKYELAIKFRAHTEFYERSVVNEWVQNGRGAGRPLATMAVMAAASGYCKLALKDNAKKRLVQVLTKQKTRFPNLDKPVIVATTWQENGKEMFTGYEEGLLAQAGLMCFLQWGLVEGLELAWISGRTTLSSMRYLNNEWTTGYQLPALPSGDPCPDSDINPPGPWLRRWSCAGVKAFLLADIQYMAAGATPPSVVDREAYRNKAITVLNWFENRDFPDDSPVETTDYIHQTMYKAVPLPVLPT